MLDLQNDKFRYLDSQVRRFCPFKGGFLALEHDVKSPGTTFNSFDASGFKWVHSSIPPLLNCDVKYPVLQSMMIMWFPCIINLMIIITPRSPGADLGFMKGGGVNSRY